jgi:hypothetical protein
MDEGKKNQRVEVNQESMFDRARQKLVSLLAIMGATAGMAPDAMRVRDMHPHFCGKVGSRGATMRGNSYSTKNSGPGTARSYLSRKSSGLLMQHEIEFLRDGNPRGSYSCRSAI